MDMDICMQAAATNNEQQEQQKATTVTKYANGASVYFEILLLREYFKWVKAVVSQSKEHD